MKRLVHSSCFSLPIVIGIIFSHYTSLAQGPVTLELTRKIYPSAGDDKNIKKMMYDTVHVIKSNGKDSIFRPIENYDLIGGDFVDGKVKFTIAVNLKWSATGMYNVYLASYKADSVVVSPFVDPRNAETAGKMIVLKVPGKEYGATVNTGGTSITLEQLEGEYKHPDVQLWDSLMPETSFKLLNGGSAAFSEYKKQNKYIYVVFWHAWEMGYKAEMDQIDQLKNISVLYRNALTVLSFHSDTVLVKQITKEKEIDWVQAKNGYEGEYFPIVPRQTGILFNSEGKAIAIGIQPDQLKPLIEKLLHVGN